MLIFYNRVLPIKIGPGRDLRPHAAWGGGRTDFHPEIREIAIARRCGKEELYGEYLYRTEQEDFMAGARKRLVQSPFLMLFRWLSPPALNLFPWPKRSPMPRRSNPCAPLQLL